jgi:hypothetical protein
VLQVSRSNVARTSWRFSAREPTMRSMFQVRKPAAVTASDDFAVRHRAVATSEIGQHRGLRRLDAETHAVHSPGAVGAEALERRVFGVALDGDLGVVSRGIASSMRE